MIKVLLGITSHGFGHLAQSAPVISALRRQCPDIDLTVRTSLPRAVVEARIAPPFKTVPAAQDFGVLMRTPFEVDRAATYSSYVALHDGYFEMVDKLAQWLSEGRFDAVVTNVSYPLLAASRRAGIPSLAMSSLNWLDMFQHYCSAFERSKDIAAQIHDSYSSATAFCRLMPGMPMPQLKTTPIPEAIASQGVNRAGRLRKIFNLSPDARIILLAFGGQSPEAPPRWDDKVGHNHLIFGPASWSGKGGPWRDPVAADMPFVDLLASADLVITKAGYGIITEIAAAGVPTLLVHRGDWPEESYLIEWLGRYAPFEYVEGPLQALEFNAIIERCDNIAKRRTSSRPPIGGEANVAGLILQLFRRQ